MSIKSYLFILFLILCASASSVGLLLFYMNPTPTDARYIAMLLMGIATALTSMSALSIVLFFIKKIYYRGDVNIHTMNASIRQSMLITVGMGFMLFLYMFQIQEARLVVAIWAVVGCLEVMIQAIE